MKNRLAAILAVIIASAAFVLAPNLATAAVMPVDNTQVTYDTLGQRVDAHDGDMLQVGSDIYLYGTSYGCGFRLNTPSAYCGVKIYKSQNLQNWTPAGAVGGSYAFNHLDQEWQDLCAPPAHFGCYRPHVVKRPSDGRYIMWLNTHGDNGYKILIADQPSGPFVDTGVVPVLAVQPPTGGLRYGDEDITIAPDGTGYVSYTAIWPLDNKHEIVIEKLDSTLSTGTGEHVVIDAQPGAGELVEAPALFLAPTGVWHIVYSDPAKPYMVTGSGIMNAPSPLGPWTFPRTLHYNSCSGQPMGVWKINNTMVYGSDRWDNGNGNQSKANNYYGPMTFNANGGTAIDAFNCVGTWTLN